MTTENLIRRTAHECLQAGLPIILDSAGQPIPARGTATCLRRYRVANHLPPATAPAILAEAKRQNTLRRERATLRHMAYPVTAKYRLQAAQARAARDVAHYLLSEYPAAPTYVQISDTFTIETDIAPTITGTTLRRYHITIPRQFARTRHPHATRPVYAEWTDDGTRCVRTPEHRILWVTGPYHDPVAHTGTAYSGGWSTNPQPVEDGNDPAETLDTLRAQHEHATRQRQTVASRLYLPSDPINATVPVTRHTAHAAGCCSDGISDFANRTNLRLNSRTTVGDLVAAYNHLVDRDPATAGTYRLYVKATLHEAVRNR